MESKQQVTERSKEEKRIVNDFSITFSTVNGSGSQTSNAVMLRAIFNMGVPVLGKNIFPSNIQGLPTWYSLRISKDNLLARKDMSEIVVAMNASTFSKDLKTLKTGGALFYADDIHVPIEREDITIYPMPIKKIIQQVDVPPSLREYVSNMAYVGILAHIIGVDLEKIHKALEFQFKGKAKPVEINYSVVTRAAEWAKENMEKKDPYYIEPMNENKGCILTDGNFAAALGSIYGGVQFVSWYPITPASSLSENLEIYLPKLRKDPESGKNTFAVIQTEDELAAIGMAIGAGWAGLRAMSATSGPGLSLMSEYLGLGYYAEVPVVLWDVQRVGPSTGLPTRTAQNDITFAAFISHGDTQYIILLPGTMNECFEFGWKAFDLAEQFQTPVIVMSDQDFGMNQWIGKEFEYPNTPMNRGKILWEEDLEKLNGKYGRYLDVDGDGVPYRTVPGNRHPESAYFTRGTGHDEYAHYSEDPDNWYQLLNRLKKKFETAKAYLPKPIIEEVKGAKIGLVAYGSTEPAVKEARFILEKMGIPNSLMRVRALPFIGVEEEFLKRNERNYIIEMNRDGQLKQLLMMEYPQYWDKVISYAYTDGMPLTAERIVDFIMEHEER